MIPEDLGYSLLYWWLLISGIILNVGVVVVFFGQIVGQIKASIQVRRMKTREREAHRRFLATVGRDAEWIDVEIIPPGEPGDQSSAF